MRRLLIVLVALAPFAFSSVPAADQPGQADLDQAADLQVTAETLGDLEKVVKLAESALAKGLDKDQKEFANKLLAATLYQHANRSVESLLERRRRRDSIDTIRKQALKDLDPELLMAVSNGAFIGVFRAGMEKRIALTMEVFMAAEQCAWEAVRR